MLLLKQISFDSTYSKVRFADMTFVEYRACISFANCNLEFVFSVLVKICDPTKTNFENALLMSIKDNMDLLHFFILLLRSVGIID